jgi:hypothetical protein
MIARLAYFLRPVIALGLLVLPTAAQTDPASAPAAPPPRVVAIFAENFAGADWESKKAAFETQLASRITSSGFSIISRDTAVNALIAMGGPHTDADQLFASQTTALHLAQNLNASYLLLVTLSSYGIDTRAFNGYGVNTVNRIATLNASYRLCEAAQGGTILSGTTSASQTIPQTANLSEDNGNLQNALLDQVAVNLASAFVQNVSSANVGSVPVPVPVPFSVSCSMADIVLPDVVQAPNNQYIIRPLAYTVEPLDVTVELNGLALGSAPGNFTGPAGINKLRLSRQGFKAQEFTINLAAGLKLNVALQMDDQGYSRWQQSLAFLQGLKENAQITDADAERIRGIAQMFRQSGLRLDEKITATALPPVQQVYPSLLSMPAPVWGAPAVAAPGAPAAPAAPVAPAAVPAN